MMKPLRASVEIDMIKYRLTPWQSSPIEPVECTSATNDTVSFTEVRNGFRLPFTHRRKMANFSYHDTWLAAHAALLESTERKVEIAQRHLKESKERLAIIKAMKQPATKP